MLLECSSLLEHLPAVGFCRDGQAASVVKHMQAAAAGERANEEEEAAMK